MNAQTLFPRLFLLLALLAGAPLHAAEQSPEAVLETLSVQMFDALRAEQAVIQEKPTRMFDLVDEVLGPHVDFPRMSAWVLGKHWRRASVEQKKRFIAAFHILLVRFYTAALLDDPAQLEELLADTDGLIVFLPSRESERGERTTVDSEVHLPSGQVVPVKFSVHRKDGPWKIYDVTVEGISVVTNYRTSFSQEIRQGGLDALIERLNTRNEDLLQQAAANGGGADKPSATQ